MAAEREYKQRCDNPAILNAIKPPSCEMRTHRSHMHLFWRSRFLVRAYLIAPRHQRNRQRHQQQPAQNQTFVTVWMLQWVMYKPHCHVVIPPLLCEDEQRRFCSFLNYLPTAAHHCCFFHQRWIQRMKWQQRAECDIRKRLQSINSA